MQKNGTKWIQGESRLGGKVINLELCRKLKFDDTTQWYMHKSESVLENETHQILWYFGIRTDHLISARRPVLWLIIKKKVDILLDFVVPVDQRVKIKEKEKTGNFSELPRKQKKEKKELSNIRLTFIPIVLEALGKKTAGTGNQRKNRDHPNINTVKIS